MEHANHKSGMKLTVDSLGNARLDILFHAEWEQKYCTEFEVTIALIVH